MVYELANGELASFDLYEARVQWDGQWQGVLVSLAQGGPLVGMALMQGYELSIQVTNGGRIELRPLSA